MVPGSRLYWDMLLIGIVLQITGYQGAVIAPISGLSCFPSEMSAQRAREGERESENTIFTERQNTEQYWIIDDFV